jgi:hypothetical protein
MIILLFDMKNRAKYKSWFPIYDRDDWSPDNDMTPCVNINYIEEMTLWIGENFKYDEVAYCDAYPTTLLFKNQEDATAFLLRWM